MATLFRSDCPFWGSEERHQCCPHTSHLWRYLSHLCLYSPLYTHHQSLTRLKVLHNSMNIKLLNQGLDLHSLPQSPCFIPVIRSMNPCTMRSCEMRNLLVKVGDLVGLPLWLVDCSLKDSNPFHSDWDGITSLAAVFILDVGLPILLMWIQGGGSIGCMCIVRRDNLALSFPSSVQYRWKSRSLLEICCSRNRCNCLYSVKWEQGTFCSLVVPG